ncbi:MAG: acyl-CoA thioesterase [Candidatus Omnitrophica bacterium]|nr:acyl-CoA thioesterase [Candidatus Omnitrophota bacterium]
MFKESVLEKKIYYHDTDAGGVVYYANYLKHLEEGRTEYCAERGIDTGKFAEEGTYFVVAHIEVDYKASARYGQTIKVNTQIEKISRSSVVYLQTITKEDKLLIISHVTWVCVNSKFRPVSIPDEIKRALEK